MRILNNIANEIIINYANAEQASAQLKKSIESFTANMPKGYASGNELDMVEAVEEVNVLFGLLFANYKALLQKNEIITSQSIITMRNADESIGNAIQLK